MVEGRGVMLSSDKGHDRRVWCGVVLDMHMETAMMAVQVRVQLLDNTDMAWKRRLHVSQLAYIIYIAIPQKVP